MAEETKEGLVYNLPVYKVPFIYNFNVSQNSSFKFNKIFIDISSKNIKSEIDIYSNGINNNPTNRTADPPFLYVTSTNITIEDDDFDRVFNTEGFNTYVYNTYRFGRPTDQNIPNIAFINQPNLNYPYKSAKYVNNVEIKNVFIDINSPLYNPQNPSAKGHSKLQIKFDAILSYTTREIPMTINGGTIPSSKEITTTVTSVAPLVLPDGSTIFNLDTFYTIAGNYALKKYDKGAYIMSGNNPFNMTLRPPGNLWKYLVFKNNSNWEFDGMPDNQIVYYIIVGGGGAGGRSGANPTGKRTIQGGGAGGVVRQGNFTYRSGCVLNVVIGAGGKQGDDASKERKGGNGGATSFVLVDSESAIIDKGIAPGGEGGGGGDSGDGKGGGYNAGSDIVTPSRGASKTRARLFNSIRVLIEDQDITESPRTSDPIVFADGCSTVWKIAGGGGIGGYDIDLSQSYLKNGASLEYKIGDSPAIQRFGGGKGVNDNTQRVRGNQGQDGSDITGLINALDRQGNLLFNSLPSGSGGGGGGFYGGKGSNGFAMFYWNTMPQ